MRAVPLRPTSYQKARPRILVVDDDPSIRLLLAKVLRNLGCTVMVTESVQGARELCASKPRLALGIVDRTLRDGDGLALVSDLRKLLGATAPPFAIYSGHDTPTRLPDGVVAVLVKPIGIVELMTFVKSVISPARSPAEVSAALAPPRVEAEPLVPSQPPRERPERRTATSVTRTVRAQRRGGIVEEAAPETGRDRRRER